MNGLANGGLFPRSLGAALGLSLSLIFTALSCGNPLGARTEEKPRNVLLITLDTVRFDYLSGKGSRRVKTPHLDRLARQGASFTRARSPVPLTLPAHASILTGLYPPEHGVRDNGSFRLAENQLSLAEVLKERGYTTAAFVGSFVLDHRFGLAQGFEVYDDRTWSDARMLENLEAERNAEAIYGAFARWLKSYRGERPFFVWIHFYDPHAPYLPPEPFRSLYAQDPYAGEIAYTDRVIGEVVEALESGNLFEHSILAVVGDHGEGLGEHREKTHSLLIYNSTLHVPMMIVAPSLVPEKREVTGLVSTLDLAPTLLDYLGFATRLGRGASLRPLIEGGAAREETPVYSESLYARLNLGWSELKGIEAGQYRFILAPRPELYDLSEDPGEVINRLESLPGVAGQLRRKLEELSEQLAGPGPSSGRPALDPETEAKLRSLGYVAGSASPARRTGHRLAVDPKDKVEVWNRIQFAIYQFGRQDYRGALDTLQRVLKGDKDIPLVYEYLGSIHMRLEEWTEAERIYRQALKDGLESAGFHLNLGLIHYQRKEIPEAKRELEISLALDPLSVPAHYHLANAFRAGGDVDKAIDHFQKALEINPAYVYARNGLGMVYARLGKEEEALREFREAVGADPRSAEAHFNLAVQLERTKRAEEALQAYRQFMRLAGERGFVRERQRAAAAISRLEKASR